MQNIIFYKVDESGRFLERDPPVVRFLLVTTSPNRPSTLNILGQ